MKKIFIFLLGALFLSLPGKERSGNRKPVKKPALTLHQQIDRSREVKELTQKYLQELRGKIDRNHPRLFFSDADFQRMKEISRTDPRFKDILVQIKHYADTVYPEEVNESTYYKTYKGKQVFYSKERFGGPASRCAYLWKLTGDRKYLKMGIKILRYAAKWYNKRFDNLQSVEWTCFTRLHALCAYDWMYNDMTPEERLSIGKDLFRHYNQASNRYWVVKKGLLSKGEGHSWWFESFYGPPMLKFYTGLVFRNKGIDDKRAEELYREGLTDHIKMLLFRAKMSDGEGSGTGSTVEYAFGDAPFCEWMFYNQYMYLTGRNIATDFPENGMFPHWLHYALFTGIDGKIYVHGTGDGWHTDNRFKFDRRYLMLYGRFFPDSPCNKLIAGWIASDSYFRHPLLYRVGIWNFAGNFPWMPHWFRYPDPAKIKVDHSFFDTMPKAYLFKNLGQLYMYSGRKKDSTYALFTCGSRSLAHKQYDENNFIIYKGGFLAMDTGTRVYSLKTSSYDYYHNLNYYSTSVAHNVVLIRMEGEKFRSGKYARYDVANHGGMNKTIGGVVRAFETNDEYTYILGDSTATYHPGKCKKMFRQFVFLQDDYFVICDTVESVKPSQTQSWLLHSQKKPVEKGDIFSFDEEQGRLFCRTFLPVNYKRTVIGGKGKDFFVDGKNFNNIDPDYIKKLAKQGIPDPKWGNYRVELTAGKATSKVRFLNLIQVGLQKDTPGMVKSSYVKEKGLEGVRFTAKNGTLCTILFNADGSGGHIRLVRNGKTIVDKPLTTKVQKQTPFKK